MPSFARNVKEEICFNDFDVPCAKALLCALIKITGSLHIGQGLSLSIRTENAKIASKTHKLLKGLYAPDIAFQVSRKMKLHKNNVYKMRVSKAREILDDLDLMEGFTFPEIPSEKIVCSEDTKRAYLAGIFLGCGSVNAPSTSNYHLEMSVNDEAHACYIRDLMNEHDLHAKVIKRRNKYIVYLKSAEKIGDFLRAIGASRSVMDFEMTRIERSMTNTVNRWNNCEIANEVKVLEASNRQIAQIALIFDKVGLEHLDDKLRRTAQLRIDNPEMNLRELALAYEETYGERISKSTLSRQFKKIASEAEKIKKMEADHEGNDRT